MNAHEFPITPQAAAALTARIRPAPTQNASAEATMTPADIWRTIRRRLALIAVVAIVLTMIGIPLNFLWYYLWPTWSSAALLRVQYPEIPAALEENRALPPANIIEQLQHSEANAISSPFFTWEVLSDDDVRATEWYKEDKTNALLRFQENLSVSPIRDSADIQVAFSTKNRKDAPIIVNRLVNVFLVNRQRRSTTEFEDRLRSLREQRATLRRDLESKNADLQAYVEAEKIPVLLAGQTEVETKLAEFGKKITESQLSLTSVREALKSMQQQDPASWTGAQARIDGDPNIRSVEARLLDLRQQRQFLGQRFGSEHMQIKNIDEIIRVASADLQVRSAELRQQFFQQSLSELENAASSLQATIEQINDEIAKVRDQKDQLNPKIVQYRQKETDRNALGVFIADLDNTIKKTQATTESVKAGQAKVVRITTAIEPMAPSSPNLKLNIPATVVLSVFIAVGLAFLLEFMDKSVRSSMCIRRHIGLTCLGTIPDLHEDEANLQDMYTIVTHAPRSLLADAFRQVRTNIMFCSRTEPFRSILITSPAPEDGRTTVSVNLAASFALTGKKVLLVDANFRKPAFNRLFQNLPDNGFAELINGQATPDQIIITTDTPGLSVLGTGNPDKLHAELLATADVKSVIDQLSTRFDLVILCGPPALLGADAISLAVHADAVLFVARARKNTHGQFNRMRDEIRRVNSSILGVVLNGVEAVGGGYLRKSYRQFYDYQLTSGEVALDQTPDLPKDSDSEPKTTEQL